MFDEFGDPITDPDKLEWTAEELKEKEIYYKFKEFEYETYKAIHKIVLADNGNPKLKKTAFRMPGYRKVLQGVDKEYEIDNTVTK